MFKSSLEVPTGKKGILIDIVPPHVLELGVIYTFPTKRMFVGGLPVDVDNLQVKENLNVARLI